MLGTIARGFRKVQRDSESEVSLTKEAFLPAEIFANGLVASSIARAVFHSFVRILLVKPNRPPA